MYTRSCVILMVAAVLGTPYLAYNALLKVSSGSSLWIASSGRSLGRFGGSKTAGLSGFHQSSVAQLWHLVAEMLRQDGL
ncbi:hypothetical protein V8C42DRAFT_304688 [Trichoderma barbatum]